MHTDLCPCQVSVSPPGNWGWATDWEASPHSARGSGQLRRPTPNLARGKSKSGREGGGGSAGLGARRPGTPPPPEVWRQAERGPAEAARPHTHPSNGGERPRGARSQTPLHRGARGFPGRAHPGLRPAAPLPSRPGSHAPRAHLPPPPPLRRRCSLRPRAAPATGGIPLYGRGRRRGRRRPPLAARASSRPRGCPRRPGPHSGACAPPRSIFTRNDGNANIQSPPPAYPVGVEESGQAPLERE